MIRTYFHGVDRLSFRFRLELELRFDYDSGDDGEFVRAWAPPAGGVGDGGYLIGDWRRTESAAARVWFERFAPVVENLVKRRVR